MSLQQTTPSTSTNAAPHSVPNKNDPLATTDNWAHVDKPKVHADFDAFYKELAPLIDANAPESEAIQALMDKHFAIVARFYVPSRDAYVGTALFYADNADMKAFHNTYHPRMVEFLGDAAYTYALQNLQ